MITYPAKGVAIIKSLLNKNPIYVAIEDCAEEAKSHTWQQLEASGYIARYADKTRVVVTREGEDWALSQA